MNTDEPAIEKSAEQHIDNSNNDKQVYGDNGGSPTAQPTKEEPKKEEKQQPIEPKKEEVTPQETKKAEETPNEDENDDNDNVKEQEEKVKAENEKQEATSAPKESFESIVDNLRCIDSSETYGGYPIENMFASNSDYWCSASAQNVYLVFDCKNSKISTWQMVCVHMIYLQSIVNQHTTLKHRQWVMIVAK